MRADCAGADLNDQPVVCIGWGSDEPGGGPGEPDEIEEDLGLPLIAEVVVGVGVGDVDVCCCC